MMLEGGRHVSSQLENWDYLWGRADKIREKCVLGLGVGGSALAGKTDILASCRRKPAHPAQAT